MNSCVIVRHVRGAAATAAALVVLGGTMYVDNALAGGTPVVAAATSTFATGLQNPRGLKFGPDGNLYVAEGGIGGSNLTVGQCEQAPFPIGPYSGSATGARISKIDTSGQRTDFATGFPSSQTGPLTGSFISGVADVAFIDGTLYALLAGAGCSHGVPGNTFNGIAKVNADGTWSMIANLSAYQQTHPVKNPEAADFEPDGTWYGMVAVRGALYAVEPNHGELVRITTDGDVARIVDFSAKYGHIVPTAIAYHGNFYVGNLDEFGVDPGSSNVYKVTPSGQTKVDAAGFTMVLGVAFDGRGRMYVLESSTADAGPVFPAPGTGRVVRLRDSGKIDVIVEHLVFPTAMTFGPDGNLYISNIGFGPPTGEILKVELAD